MDKAFDDIYLLYISFGEEITYVDLTQTLTSLSIYENQSNADKRLVTQRKFSPDSESKGIQFSFSELPQKQTTKSLELQIRIPSSSNDLKLLFSYLESLMNLQPFELMDTQLKRKYLMELQGDGQVDKYLSGLTPEIEAELKTKSIIPISFDDFNENVHLLERREELLGRRPVNQIDLVEQAPINKELKIPKFLKWILGTQDDDIIS